LRQPARWRSPRNGVSKLLKSWVNGINRASTVTSTTGGRRQQWSGLTDRILELGGVRPRIFDAHQRCFPENCRQRRVWQSRIRAGGNGLNGSYRISSDGGVGLTVRIEQRAKLLPMLGFVRTVLWSSKRIPEAVFTELVDIVFTSLPPVALIGVILTAVGILVAAKNNDLLIWVLVILSAPSPWAGLR
jgi:hypothetical protein